MFVLLWHPSWPRSTFCPFYGSDDWWGQGGNCRLFQRCGRCCSTMRLACRVQWSFPHLCEVSVSSQWHSEYTFTGLSGNGQGSTKSISLTLYICCRSTLSHDGTQNRFCFQCMCWMWMCYGSLLSIEKMGIWRLKLLIWYKNWAQSLIHFLNVIFFARVQFYKTHFLPEKYLLMA